MTPEKIVQTAILDKLRTLQKQGHPIIVDRRQAGGFSYKMGMPDIWFSYNGQHVECEVKAPGGKLRPMQEKWRDKCLRAHILYLCADSIDDLNVFLKIHFDIDQNVDVDQNLNVNKV